MVIVCESEEKKDYEQFLLFLHKVSQGYFLRLLKRDCVGKDTVESWPRDVFKNRSVKKKKKKKNLGLYSPTIL